jgi:hypothetical protein
MAAQPNSLVAMVGNVTEHHFSPEELGKSWGLSSDTIRRLFEHEPGVLVIERARARGRRRYRTLRIPQSVADRVHRRLSHL